MDDPVSFGQWVKRRRRALDLTQKELAQCVGYSISALRKLESDERRPSRQIAELLADCLGIQVEERELFLKAARGILSFDHLPPAIRVFPGNHSSEHPRSTSTTNLPLQLSSLIGREAELANLSQMLQDPQCRLINLVGPGGNGKTHLAVEAAALNQDKFIDGVFFVSLTSLSSPEFVIPAIAGALDFTFFGATDPKIQIINYLDNKDLLLLFDGVEHVPGSVQLIMDLLCQAPGIKLLVTSQERLNLQGEWVFEVHGLAYPSDDQIEDALEYSAVDLFLQCAHRVKAEFNPGPGEMKWIVKICRMARGMPLGIELAAAWIRVLSPREIGEEIQRDLDFLSGSPRDEPERHHSLRAVFDYSWNLLTAEEQRGLCQLSVFKGGFQRESALGVAGASIQLLSALVDKSLLQRTPAGRYDMHELLRHYTWSKLMEMPDQGEQVRDRHCGYYMGLLQIQEEHLIGPGQKESLDLISQEFENIREAWGWATQRHQVTVLQKPIRSLGYFFDIRGRFQEAERVFRQTIQDLEGNQDLNNRFGEDYQVLIPRLYSQRGWFCMRLGKNDQARLLLERSVQLISSTNTKGALIEALHNLGVFYRNAGEYQPSQGLFREMAAVAAQIQDQWNLARANANLGLGSQAMGYLQEAHDKTVSAIKAFRNVGDTRMVAMELQYLGGISSELGFFEEAKKDLQESLKISQEIDDPWGVGMALTQLSMVLQNQDDPLEAVKLSRESLALFRGLGEILSILHSLNQLGRATMALGDYHQSQQIFSEALRTALEVHNLPEILETLAGISRWLMDKGELEEAGELVDLISTNPASSKEVLDRVNEIQSQLEIKTPGKPSRRINGNQPSLESVAEEVLEKYLKPETTQV